jgi:hypothetical protein
MFRQQLNRLLEDIFLLTDAPATHLARARKKAQDLKNRTRIQQRLAFWQSVLLTNWQHTFSQLVADGRFAVLGVVLIASLAQVCAITGLTANLEQLGQAEVEKVLEEFAREDWDLGPHLTGSADFEDLGQVVKREQAIRSMPAAESDQKPHSNESKKSFGAAVGTPTNHARPVTKEKCHNRKRRNKDAIDDLFSDLL